LIRGGICAALPIGVVARHDNDSIRFYFEQANRSRHSGTGISAP
jgi:hypothetical protein